MNIKKMEKKSDHDILIRLVEIVENNQQNLLGRLDQIKEDMNEMKDGTGSRLSGVETRISFLESVHTKYTPEPLVKLLYDHDRWIQDFKVTWRVVVMMAATVGGIIGFVLSTLNDITNLFLKR